MSRSRKNRRNSIRRGTFKPEPTTFVPAPPNPDVLRQLVDSGFATVTNGTLSMFAGAAWDIDPWVWAPADGQGEMGKKLPVEHKPLAVYLSRDYQVAVFEVADPGNNWPAMWHLSLKRRDREPIDENRWRILQRIKNTLVGPEHEAVELYPGESRLVDTANQYHIFVFRRPDVQWPFGFTNRYVTSGESHGSKQRALPEGTSETDEAVFKKGMADIYGAPEDKTDA